MSLWLDNHEEELINHDNRIARLESLYGSLKNKVDSHDNKINSIENKLSSLEQRISSISQQISILQVAIQRLEQSIRNQVSDKRLKNVLGENLNAMDKINRIKVYDFTFKTDDLKTPHIGVMAQDLQKIFPNAVTKDENGYLQIRHEDMFYAMINALKELDAKIKQIALQLAENIKIVTSDSGKIRDLTIRINNQDKEIKALKKEVAKIDDLKKEIADLKKRVNK